VASRFRIEALLGQGGMGVETSARHGRRKDSSCGRSGYGTSSSPPSPTVTLLRPLFRRRRDLLTELAGAGAEATAELVRPERMGEREGDAGRGMAVGHGAAEDRTRHEQQEETPGEAERAERAGCPGVGEGGEQIAGKRGQATGGAFLRYACRRDAEGGLVIGRTLSHYRITAAIGAGGMGEVYRATDTKLGREVALKRLPEAFASDPERLARFEREARLLASLNHPGIAHLYGFETATLEDATTVHLITMELVEGEDLAERLKRGPIPLDEAIAIAKQVAEALEEAHEKGIVHRDLKPGNIKVTSDGRVKVLDFGLAKAWTGDGAGTTSSADLSQSPTLAQTGTAAGIILGTAAYMSPEQARGKAVDKKADIWAFGVVLWEMLTGQRLFVGETVSDVLAAVLTREPEWAVLTPRAPGRVREILRRCLERNPKRRLHDIADARILLEEAISGAAGEAPVAATTGEAVAPRRRKLLLAALATLALVSAGLAWTLGLLRSRSQSALPIRLALPAPEKTTFGPGSALSHDGRSLVFVGTRERKQLLWLRPLAGFEAQPLPGTDGAVNPFWSPDGRFVGFFTASKLKTIEVATGAVKTLCDLSSVEPLGGGSWSRDGVIVFSPDAHSPLYRVSAAGGEPARVTELGREQGEGAHLWPEFLPDGRHVVFYVLGGGQDGIAVTSLDSREKRLLIPRALRAAYASPGFLLFLREGTLLAQPFDAARSRLSGEPLQVAENVDAYFSVADDHILAYRAGASDARQLRWFDRSGRELAKVGRPGDYWEPSLSPDGTRVAVGVGAWTPVGDVWLLELSRGSFSRLTSDPRDDATPVWSPDGKEIVFASNRNGPFDLYRKDAGGTGSDELVLQSSADKFPIDWSRDGKYLLYYAVDPKTKADLWALPMSGERKPTPFLETEFNESNALFSPDGRWVAHNSDESGTPEIYVRPFPPAGGKWQVSTQGGVQPVWSSDGKQLYYLALDGRIMAVEVKPGSAFAAGLPVPLFDSGLRPEGLTESRSSFVVSDDGQRFLVNTIAEEAAHVPITVVVNWAAGLRK